MSTCISREGEFSEHTLDATGEHRFTCRLCWVTDEDAMLAALDAADARLASVEALADKWQAEAQGRSSHAMHVLWDCGDDLRAVLGSDAHTEQKGTGE